MAFVAVSTVLEWVLPIGLAQHDASSRGQARKNEGVGAAPQHCLVAGYGPEALMETGLSDLCRDPCRALYRSANEPATAVARNRGRSAGRRA